MCGIAGFIGEGSPEDVQQMTAPLRHRGPDNQQYLVQENVGLGFARLCIIDLAAEANQPFLNEDQTKALVFNGEIYNFIELRARLSSRGHTFRTSSDTEVLLAMYEHFGTEMFSMIEGMFAFAIYDFRERALLLARDRMGEKPLYYGMAGSTFVFASEIKALLRHPLVERKVDLSALRNYLTFDYVPAPLTIFSGIKKLEPGCFLTFRNSQIAVNRYWDIRFGNTSLSFAEACDALDQKLSDAVRTKLIADVPVGFFLSGGLDSSTVAYYARKHSSSRIRTFSIGFEDKSYDETKFAQEVATFLGSEHHSAILTEAETLTIIPRVTESMDEPFADPSLIPTFLLAQFTRKHVTVALGGDGSDELLGGYPTFVADRFIGAANVLPAASRFLIDTTLKLIPPSDRNIGMDFKLKQFRKGIGASRHLAHTLWLSSFDTPETEALLSPEIVRELQGADYEQTIHYHLRGRNLDAFNKDSLIYFKTYLPDDILVKVDRASMLSSLEVRSPFLDHNLVEFVNSLPESYKRKGLQTKRILKKTMEGKLPSNIIHRPKKGFGIPLSLWLRRELRGLCEELLSKESLSQHNFFNYAYVDRIKQEHFAGRVNHRKQLWNLMIFQMWFQHYGR